MYLTGILVSLIKTTEATDNHPTQSTIFLYFNIEVAHQEAGEIELRHFKQQFVFADRIGIIDHHIQIVGNTLLRELLYLDAVAVVHDRRTTIPYITQIESSTT